MSKIIYLVFIITFLFSCNKKIIDNAKLEARNGIYYEYNSQKPYTGKTLKYRDTILESESEFKNGVLNGLSRVYNIDGQLHSKFLYRNGNIKEKFQIKSDNSVVMKSYYENGQLLTESFYKDKNLHNGSAKSYYEDGKIQEIVTYENNVKVFYERFEDE